MTEYIDPANDSPRAEPINDLSLSSLLADVPFVCTNPPALLYQWVLLRYLLALCALLERGQKVAGAVDYATRRGCVLDTETAVME